MYVYTCVFLHTLAENGGGGGMPPPPVLYIERMYIYTTPSRVIPRASGNDEAET